MRIYRETRCCQCREKGSFLLQRAPLFVRISGIILIIYIQTSTYASRGFFVFPEEILGAGLIRGTKGVPLRAE